MTWLPLVRAEVRKLTTTKITWGFLTVLVVLSGVTASAVIWGTDADGSKGFISTSEDQRSLTAFGANAMIIAGLFGAIAVSREYGHGTVVPTFLAAPRRYRAVLAQYTALLVGGALLGLVGAVLTIVGVAVTLPTTDHDFLMSAGGVIRVVTASAFMGASGALLGAGAGAIVRNMGGAVTGAVLVLLVIPPLAVQLIPEAISWVPGALVRVLSGLGGELGVLTAVVAVAVWGAIPAAVGLVLVQRRDVV
jgi:ABC-2 type transport system permease protein